MGSFVLRVKNDHKIVMYSMYYFSFSLRNPIITMSAVYTL